MTETPSSEGTKPGLLVQEVNIAEINAICSNYLQAECNELQPILWIAKDSFSGSQMRATALLSDICTMMLTPSEPNFIYRPRSIWTDGTGSLNLDHLSEDDIFFLSQIASQISQPALRARISDLVWLLGRKYGVQFAHTAINAYCCDAIDSSTWHIHGRDSWHRALQLAKQIRADDIIENIEKAILDAFFALSSNDGYLALQFVKPLFTEKRSGEKKVDVAGQLERIGHQNIDEKQYFVAESYFSAAADWYQWAKLPEEQDTALAMAARAIALQAELADGAAVQHGWYTKAIDAYRRVPKRSRERLDINPTIESLRRSRERAGHAMLEEMTLIKGPSLDISDIVRASIKYVAGRSPVGGLLAFCGLDQVPDAAKLLTDAEANLEEFFISALFSGVVMANDGRQVANTGNQANRGAQVIEKARELFREHAGFVAVSSLIPALDQIRNEHFYRLGDFISIAEQSPVVPKDRAVIVAKGLYAGFHGDMIQAMHILMPQFEHMVRHLLQAREAFTAEHRPDGLDMEVALGSLIERQEMVEEFGEGLTIAIHAIMCDGAGSNLRNDVAHGLADEKLCASPYAFYAWWMILHLVVKTFAATRDITDDC